MSAQECITAARLQNLHPNISRHTNQGHFGSKFVTVVVTGGKGGEIHFEGYQVSNVAMALQAANILSPTYDAPELGYIRETTKQQFVPDVFYSVCSSCPLVFTDDPISLIYPCCLNWLLSFDLHRNLSQSFGVFLPQLHHEMPGRVRGWCNKVNPI